MRAIAPAMLASKISRLMPFSSNRPATSFWREYFAAANALTPLSSRAERSDAFPSTMALTLALSPARMASKNSLLMLFLRLKDCFGFRHLPSQVVNVKQQYGLRVRVLELVVAFLLPSLGQIFRAIHVLVEESVLVGHAEIVQHGFDHVQVRNQDGLRKVGSEVFIILGQARPQTRLGLAKMFGIEFGEAEPCLDAVIELIGFQFADGNGAQELRERVFPQALKDGCKLHKKPA